MITPEELRSRFDYNPETGIFTSKIKRGVLRIGATVGCTYNGYIRIGIDYRYYLGHRLAWLYMTGEWPSQVDHRNGVRNDNRWQNLRIATHTQNHQNKSILCTNKSGYKGVQPSSKTKNRWIATIKVGLKIKYLGTFDCPKKAHLAYIHAANEHFGEFARAR